MTTWRVEVKMTTRYRDVQIAQHQLQRIHSHNGPISAKLPRRPTQSNANEMCEANTERFGSAPFEASRPPLDPL
eukprot:7342031-Pyramimonas_sp.AAC.1